MGKGRGRWEVSGIWGRVRLVTSRGGRKKKIANLFLQCTVGVEEKGTEQNMGRVRGRNEVSGIWGRVEEYGEG